jgi:hypothetical protein
MDVDSLEAGVDFVDAVLQAIQSSTVVLILIGDRWLTTTDNGGRRRLDDPTDNVRMEIEHALRLRKPLLPVLLDGAGMPRPDELPASLAPLPRLNGIPRPPVMGGRRCSSDQSDQPPAVVIGTSTAH